MFFFSCYFTYLFVIRNCRYHQTRKASIIIFYCIIEFLLFINVSIELVKFNECCHSFEYTNACYCTIVVVVVDVWAKNEKYCKPSYLLGDWMVLMRHELYNLSILHFNAYAKTIFHFIPSSSNTHKHTFEYTYKWFETLCVCV